MEIRLTPQEVAKPFIEKWHYSHRCPTGKNIFFGWFIDGAEYNLETDLFGESLYAVADYGVGVNPYQAQSLSILIDKQVDDEHLIELKRLCRIEPKIEGFPLTRFISRCHKVLRKMGYFYVVTFSDPSHGHTGGIYKAANFTYLGKTNPENHAVDRNGEIRHRRFYYRYARRNGISVSDAREELRIELTKTVAKDRWFLRI